MLGPFDISTIPGLCLNSFFAVNQSDKYHSILNLSYFENQTVTAIIPHKMRIVTMSTARQFADTLCNTGQGSYISKLDHVSAYKLVPTKPDHF